MPEQQELVSSVSSDMQPNFTQIPNVILDQLLPHLTGAELKIIMVICRQTYGWHKESDRISLSQLEQKTGLHKDTLSSSIKSLKDKQIIRVAPGSGHLSTLYSIEYNIQLWKIDGLVTEGGKIHPSEGGKIPPSEGGKIPPSEGGKIPPHKIKRNKEKENKKKEGKNSSSSFGDIDKLRPTFENIRKAQQLQTEALTRKMLVAETQARAMIASFRGRDSVYDAFCKIQETIQKERPRMYRLLSKTLTDYNAKAKEHISKLLNADIDVCAYTKWYLSKSLKFKGFTWAYFCADSFILEFDAEKEKQTAPVLSAEEKLKKLRASVRRS